MKPCRDLFDGEGLVGWHTVPRLPTARTLAGPGPGLAPAPMTTSSLRPTRRAGDQATRRPGDQATRRPGEPATLLTGGR
jgi:hypothetical protein